MKRGLLLVLLCAAAARAQEEPTPFWLPPPPPKKEAPKPPKKTPVRVEPPKPKKREKPLPAAATPPVEKAHEPTWIEPPSRAAEPVLPPEHAPIEVEPETAPIPRAPAATLPPPPEPAPAREPAVPREPAASPAGEAAPELPREPAVAVDSTPEPAPAEAEAAPDFRPLSLAASFGAWAKSPSDGSSRSWQLAYGVRLGYAIFPSLEAELELVRSSATAGSPFVNASTAHNLATLRAFYVLGDRLALLLGGGGGIAMVQTHYTLQPSTDPTSVATGVDAVGIKPVIEVTAVGRARIFRGLEARAEVSALARDGRIDFLPLLGIGWAF